MTTKEVIEKFSREEGIALYNSKKTDKEIYDLLVPNGLTDNYETFVDEAKKIFTEKVSQMSKEEIMAQIEGAELTDEQLEQIAGGKDDDEKTEVEKDEESLLYVGLGVGAFCAGTAGVIAGAITGSAAAAGAAF